MFRSLDLWISSVHERYMMSGGIPSSPPKDAVGETNMDESEEEDTVEGEEGRREAEEEGDTEEERAMAAAVAPFSS